MTDLILPDSGELVDLQPDEAFARLWEMLSHQDGSPRSIEAINMLSILAQAWDGLSAEKEGLVKALRSATYQMRATEFERDQAIMKLHEIQSTADRKARKEMAKQIATQHNISEDAARYLLDFMMREGDWALNGYAQRIMNTAIEEACQEIEDFLDAEHRPFSEDTDYDA